MINPTLYGASPFQPGMTTDVFIPDQLIGGDLKVVTDTATITGGAYYKRGTVLGLITATSKYTLATAGASDGSQTPSRILVDDVDTTGGDQPGGVYRQIEANGNALILGSGMTLAAAKAALEADPSSNIYIKAPVTAADPS